MSAGPNVAVCAATCETQSMSDRTRCSFIVVEQPRKNGQSCSIGRSPPVRAQCIRIQSKDCSGAGLKGTVSVGICGVEFVENSIVGVNHENMPVASVTGGPGAAFDFQISIDRILSVIAFIVVFEGNGCLRCIPWHYIVWTPEHVDLGPNIWMKSR